MHAPFSRASPYGKARGGSPWQAAIHSSSLHRRFSDAWHAWSAASREMYPCGTPPGTDTARYFDTILTRLTTIGAFYLVAVCLLPEILISKYGVPFYFGGTSLMIIVSVSMDTITQMQSHLLAHQYEGLIKKARVKGRGR